MSSADQAELLRKTDEAWRTLEHHVHEVIAPRFYKEKRGRKQELINPWKDMRERLAAEEKEHELHSEWLHLFQRYVAEYRQRPILPILYQGQETPNGIRYVKVPLKEL